MRYEGPVPEEIRAVREKARAEVETAVQRLCAEGFEVAIDREQETPEMITVTVRTATGAKRVLGFMKMNGAGDLVESRIRGLENESEMSG